MSLMLHRYLRTEVRLFRSDERIKTFSDERSPNVHLHAHTGEWTYLYGESNKTLSDEGIWICISV